MTSLPSLVGIPLLLGCTALLNPGALAKEGCAHSWAKGNYRTFQEVAEQLRERFIDSRILRLALCHAEQNDYFSVTILEPSGKVRVVQVPAR